jgi:AcrR family transcriptional regulator
MPPVKEEIRRFKRERILEAASQLFYERGFSGTTMDDVAGRLSVTKPFIYTYFENKHALLVAIYEMATQRLLSTLQQAMSLDGTPDEQLRDFVQRFARENMESVMISTVFLQEEKHLDEKFLMSIRKHQHEFDRQLAELIRRGRAAGVFHVEDPTVASLAITGMVRWLQRWYKPAGRLPVDEISRLLADMALGAVGFRAAPRTGR